MLKPVRSSIRIHSRTLFSSRHCPFHTPRRNASGLSFKQAEATGDQEDMDQQEKQTTNQHATTGDGLSHSFGEGYATRCDEEGFGGIYSRDDADDHSTEKKPPSKIIHESHPEFDKTQGSEVAEREKARHQKAVEKS